MAAAPGRVGTRIRNRGRPGLPGGMGFRDAARPLHHRDDSTCEHALATGRGAARLPTPPSGRAARRPRHRPCGEPRELGQPEAHHWQPTGVSDRHTRLVPPRGR